jgi:hypothetical protein
VGMRSFSNLFEDGNRSRRKPFIVEIHSCDNMFQGGNPFYSLKCLKKETIHAKIFIHHGNPFM